MKDKKSKYLDKAQLAEALNIPIVDVNMLLAKKIIPGPLPWLSVERWTFHDVVWHMRQTGYCFGSLSP